MDTRDKQDTSGRDEAWLWLWPLLLLILVAGCLVLMSINTTTGYLINGLETHFWIEAVTNRFPFCPPRVPCEISALNPRNHWTVWIFKKTNRLNGIEINAQKLIDIPLWY
jgi:hypothetical protein